MGAEEAAFAAPPRDAALMQGVLANMRMLSGMEAGALQALLKRCWTMQVKRNGLVAPREKRLPGVFAIAYGSVKLCLRAANGEERVVRLLAGGQSFGESTALMGAPSVYEARALADTKLIVIPTAALLALMDRDTGMGRALTVHLAARNIELMRELQAATLLDAPQRLAAFLRSLQPGMGQPAINLPVTKTVVAARLGMKKETLSRLLRQFTSDGLLEVSRREVKILDGERLAQLADGGGGDG